MKLTNNRGQTLVVRDQTITQLEKAIEVLPKKTAKAASHIESSIKEVFPDAHDAAKEARRLSESLSLAEISKIIDSDPGLSKMSDVAEGNFLGWIAPTDGARPTMSVSQAISALWNDGFDDANL